MSVVGKSKSFLGAALLCALAVTGVLAWHGGYRLYVVHTGSMTPTLQIGDAVLDGPPKGTYRPREIITFRHSDLTTDLVTHTVIDVTAGKIHTKGDANRTADVWEIRPDQVQGVVVRRLPRMGYLLIFLKKPAGIASVVLGGLAIMLMLKAFAPSTKGAASTRGATESEPTNSEPTNKPAPATVPPDGAAPDPTKDPTAEPTAKAEAAKPSP